MLNNASCFKKVFIATGYSDLRRGLESLSNIIRFQFHLDPYDKDTLYLFCGRRNDRIKGLLWEGAVFSFSIRDLITELSTGREPSRKHWRSHRNSIVC